MDPEEIILPCDVMLPPRTIVGKGCKLSTLLEAIEHRRDNPSAPLHFARLSVGSPDERREQD